MLIAPQKMSREKVQYLRALGAEVRLIRSDVGEAIPNITRTWRKTHPRNARRLLRQPVRQPANPQAHETTTGPEIWSQLEKGVDAVVVGVGSGGTLSGLGRFFARVSPKTEMVLADPASSVLAPLVRTGERVEAGFWTVEGIGEDFVPPNCDLSFVKKAYSISD